MITEVNICELLLTAAVFAIDGDFFFSAFASDADVAIHEAQRQILTIVGPAATRDSSAHLKRIKWSTRRAIQ